MDRKGVVKMGKEKRTIEEKIALEIIESAIKNGYEKELKQINNIGKKNGNNN